MGDKLYHRRIDPRSRMYWVVYLPSITHKISAHASHNLDVSTIPSSHYNIFLRLHHFFRRIGFQLFSHVAARLWKKRDWGINFEDFL
jgi:hypothetical protein